MISCDRFGSRGDAGCEYWLKVRLLNGDMEELCTREHKDTKEAEGDWYQVLVLLKTNCIIIFAIELEKIYFRFVIELCLLLKSIKTLLNYIFSC